MQCYIQCAVMCCVDTRTEVPIGNFEHREREHRPEVARTVRGLLCSAPTRSRLWLVGCTPVEGSISPACTAHYAA